uniref:Uncharacterized protein n=1 Tax=Pristionchus pacificus TaxID=54126 RepID=A0A2A6C5V8_PRIPA|eukprot:PDM73496.1 hypothetical protein PRIPAC_40852 [Pristionchus pacificus]
MTRAHWKQLEEVKIKHKREFVLDVLNDVAFVRHYGNQEQRPLYPLQSEGRLRPLPARVIHALGNGKATLAIALNPFCYELTISAKKLARAYVVPVHISSLWIAVVSRPESSLHIRLAMRFDLLHHNNNI